MKEKLHKYSFWGCFLLAGIVFFTWTDNWQVYTEPLQEAYTEGVQLADSLTEGKWLQLPEGQSDGTGSGYAPGEMMTAEDTGISGMTQTSLARR